MLTQFSFGFPKYRSKGTKSFHNERAQLRNNGWHKIGSGNFSQVYGHKNDPGRVIKISGSLDDAWPVYAKLAMTDLVDHPNVPAVYSLDYHKSYYISEMERLEKMPDDDDDDLEAFRLWRQYGIVRSTLLNGSTLPALSETDDYRLFDLGKYLRRYSSYSIDLHERNIMVRKATLVVTDPWAFKKSSNH